MRKLIGLWTKRSENRCISERNEYERAIPEESTASTQAHLGRVEHWMEEIEEHSPQHGSVAQSSTGVLLAV